MAKGLEFKEAKGKNVEYAQDGDFIIIRVKTNGERWTSNGPAKSQMVAVANFVYEVNGKKCVLGMNSYEKNTKSNLAAQNEAMAAKIKELEARVAAGK